jgi:diadenylate cyclase
MSGWRTVIDLIDVAIVAFVVYHLLLLLRGRRAMQMLTSLFVIVIIGFVARWLQFDALNWLMSGLKGIWAVIFVILFQDDLRRLLGQVGQSRFLRPLVKLEEHLYTTEPPSSAAIRSSRHAAHSPSHRTRTSSTLWARVTEPPSG